MTVVTFLSDFGLRDDFVGTCHGVIAKIAPDARVIDVTHGIAPQAVLQGAVVLDNTTPYMPVGVHLAVVDPDVGGNRRAVAIRTGDGRTLVGPDNGLLMLAGDALGVDAVHELTEARYRLPIVSHTFHARDIFAPAAAHLARGVPLEELGPAIDAATLRRVSIPDPEVGRTQISARVLAVDRFGNVATNARRGHLTALGVEVGDKIEVRVSLDRYFALVAETFADAAPGELILYEDSYGAMAIAVRDGNAGRLTGAGPGDRVRIRVTAVPE